MTASIPGEPWKEVLCRNEQEVLREIADEILLVPVRGRLAQLQQLFVLNPVAHFIWQELDGAQCLEDVHRRVVESFDVSPGEARADLLELENLREAGLVDRAEGMR